MDKGGEKWFPGVEKHRHRVWWFERTLLESPALILRPPRRSLMFLGEYRHTLDAKGRVNLPTKFRSVLSKGIVLTRGVDRCLFGYPRATWERLAADVARLPFTQAAGRAFTRLFLAGAMDGVPDSQGRVMLPEYLRAYAGIRKRIVVAGVYDRLEIWDADTWARYTRRAERKSEAIAETLGQLSRGESR